MRVQTLASTSSQCAFKANHIADATITKLSDKGSVTQRVSFVEFLPNKADLELLNKSNILNIGLKPSRWNGGSFHAYGLVKDYKSNTEISSHSDLLGIMTTHASSQNDHLIGDFFISNDAKKTTVTVAKLSENKQLYDGVGNAMLDALKTVANRISSVMPDNMISTFKESGFKNPISGNKNLFTWIKK